MRYVKTSSYLALVGALLFIGNASLAQVIETTTTRTTTTSPAGTIVEQTTSAPGSYVVVDPITGAVRAYYDPIRKQALNGVVLQSGLVVVDRVNGRLMGTVNNSGAIVDLTVAPAVESLVLSIDTRRKELEVALDSALSKGQITAQQAQDLRAQLDKIVLEETAARNAGSINFAQALVFASSLDALQTRLVPLTKTVMVQPVISPQFITVEGRTIFTDDITYRRIKIGQRIDDEYAAGRLSAKQVADLKSRLNAISSDESKYRKNGELSSSKNKMISVKLDKVQTAMEKDVALINHRRSQIGIRVD